MKPLNVLLAAILALNVSLPSLAEEVSEKTVPLKEMTKPEREAVNRFKSEMGAVKTWFTAYLESCQEKEALSHQIPLKVTEKLSAIHAEGIPKDLNDAFQAFSGDFRKQAALLKEMPKEDAAIMEWMAKKQEDQKFIAESETLMEAQYASGQALIKVAAAYGAESEVDLYDTGMISEEQLMADRWVVILGSHKTFEDAKKQAEDFAKKSKVPFTMNGMVYDAEGLHYPKDFEDEVYAGAYVARRGNFGMVGDKEVEDFLSVEKSDDYTGFTPGLYIVVGKIAESAEDSAKQVETFKNIAPDTYAKQTKIYIGCDH